MQSILREKKESPRDKNDPRQLFFRRRLDSRDLPAGGVVENPPARDSSAPYVYPPMALRAIQMKAEQAIRL